MPTGRSGSKGLCYLFAQKSKILASSVGLAGPQEVSEPDRVLSLPEKRDETPVTTIANAPDCHQQANRYAVAVALSRLSGPDLI